MALPNWIQGATRPSLALTWYREGTTTPENLTGATLSGLIRRSSGTTVAIAGTLTVTDGAAGEFRWDMDAADVASAGRHAVQFVAAFGSGQTPAKTFATEWNIVGSLSAS